MKTKRLVPRPRSGITNRKAPYWRGDTAEKVMARRLAERAQQVKERRRGRRSGRASRSSPPGDDRLRLLRRLERALIRRKTLAARQRLEQRIKDLRSELES